MAAAAFVGVDTTPTISRNSRKTIPLQVEATLKEVTIKFSARRSDAKRSN